MQRAVLIAARRRAHILPFKSRWTTRRIATEPPTGSGRSQTPNPQRGLERILSRAPKFLRPTLSALQNAPITHVTAFLILHELTAIIPLLGLAGAFHYYHWLPTYFAEGAWVVAGVEKFGRYFRRKGWIGAEEEAEAEREVKSGVNAAEIESKGVRTSGENINDSDLIGKEDRTKWWNKSQGGVRWVVEFATAYAIVKALLPVRIFLSVWGAPGFARWTIVPAAAAVRRMFGRSAGA